MEIFYKGKYYELVELKEPQSNTTFDIVAIFESNYTKEDENGNEIPTTKEDFENNIDRSWRLGNFINYFFGANEETPKSIQIIAKQYIDEYESEKKKRLLEMLKDLEEERINKDHLQGLSKEQQLELDDGDNLLQAIDILKGVLEDGKKN